MIRNLILLPDGREVFSGEVGSAVMSLELTESVCSGKELAPGAVCAAMVQLTLLDRGDLNLNAGDALTLYQVDEKDNRTLLGVFLAEKPQRNDLLLTVTAYDRMLLLDKDLTAWLQGLNGWPYTLRDFGAMVCDQCGLTLANTEFPNGEFAIEAFTAENVTGRQLLSWVAEAAGCFCRMNREGQPELRWYTPAPVAAGAVEQSAYIDLENQSISLAISQNAPVRNGSVTLESTCIACTDDGEGNVVLTVQEGLSQQFYFQGALALEDYRTVPIEKIQLRQSAQDVGTVYPDMPQGNTLAITANPLLAAQNATTLLPVAQTLYDRFGGISYTPGVLELPDTPGLAAGQILTVADSGGNAHTLYIMELTRSEKGIRIQCTGSYRRDSSFAVNNVTQSARGKMLQLRCDVDGLAVQNSDNAGRLSALELSLEGIRGQVTSLDQESVTQRLTTLEQTAEGLRLSVQSIQDDGASKITTGMGYTFDDNGLEIARIGEEMCNKLDNTGMYVTRGGQTILQANNRGVTAVDVTVGNYLVVGNHARLEDYAAGRTACFYLGG